MFRIALIFAIFIAVVSSDLWDSFKKTFDKHYGPQEEQYRRNAFDKTRAIIAENNFLHDLGLSPFRMGLNYYSDRPWEEFRTQMLTVPETPNSIPNVSDTHTHKPTIDSSFDWKDRGFETSVKDQKVCGASFAFAAAAAAEFRLFRNSNGQNIDLSAQQILDCSNNGNCKGGSPAQALEFVKRNGGLCPEKNYPYISAQNGDCKPCTKLSYSIINGVKNIDHDGIEAAIVKYGPVVASIRVTSEMIGYKAGENDVLDIKMPCVSDEAEGDMQHVLVVGYGITPDDKKYWRIKNSWGESWGYRGYAKIARNPGHSCQIFKNPMYVS